MNKLLSKMNVFSFIKYFLVALLALLLIVSLLFTWLAATQSGLQWLSQRAITFAPELSIGNIKGRLIGPLSIDDLRYQTQEFDLSIKSAGLDWHPSELLLSTLVVNYVTASNIVFKQTTAPKEKPEDASPPPTLEDIIESLQLPISILIQKAEINELVFDGGYYKRVNYKQDNSNNNNQQQSDAFILDYFLLAAKSDSQKIQIDSLRLESSVAHANGSLTLGLASSQQTSGDIDWTLLPKTSQKKPPENTLPSIKGKTQLSGNTQTLTINNTLQPPYASSLAVKIKELTKTPSAAGELSLNKININEINSDWPSYEIEGNIDLKGDLNKAVFDSQFSIVDQDQKASATKQNKGTVTITSKGNWENEILDIALNASAPSFFETINVEAINIDSQIRPSQLNEANSKAIDLALNWKNINKPSEDDNTASNSKASTHNNAQLFSPEGQINLSGNLKQYKFNLGSAFEAVLASSNTGIQEQKGELIIQGEGTDEKIKLNEIALSGPMGSLNGEGDIKISSPIAANIQLLGKNLNPEFLSPEWPGQLDLAIDIETNNNQGDTRINAAINSQGVLRSYPFSLIADALYANDIIELSNLALKSGNSNIEASALIDKNKMLTAEWSIDSKQLQELVPGIRGSLQSKGLIASIPTTKQTASDLHPKVIASFNASSLRLDNNQFENIKANIDIDWAPAQTQSKNQIDIGIKNVTTDAIKISSASINLNGRPEQHNITSDIDTDKGNIELALSGSLFNLVDDTQWRFSLDEASLSPTNLAPIVLEEKAQGFIKASKQALNQHCWRADVKQLEQQLDRQLQEKAQLCFSGSQNTGQVEAAFSILRLPTDYFTPLMPEGLSWTKTRIDGDGTITLPPSKDLNANIELKTSAGDLNWTQDQISSDKNSANTENTSTKKTTITDASPSQSLALGAGTLSITSQAKKLTAYLSLPIEKQTGFKGNMTMTNNQTTLLERPLNGSLQLELDKLSPFASFIPDASELKGSLNSEWRIGGSIQEPWLDGQLNLQNAQVRLNAPGIFLEKIDVNLIGTQQNGINYKAIATSGGGTLEATGKVLLDTQGPAVELKVKGDQFQVINTEEATAYASPDLFITSKDQTTEITGTITIPEAAITPKKLPPSVVTTSEDQVIISGNEQADNITSKQNVSMDIDLVLGDQVLIDAFGFKGKTQGSLKVTKTNQGPTLANGKIKILEGEYRAFGQGLVIDKGEILYADGPINKPGLDIKALRRPAEGITVGVLARGSVTQPDLTIFSEPAMTQTEQLSWLVLGRSPEQSSDGENNAINQLLLSFSLSKGDSYLNSLKDTFQLDTLNINTGSGEAGAASDNDLAELVLGKYLSPDLYVSYGIGLFKPVNVLSLEYSLGKRWKLKSETSSESSGGDLVYTIER